MNRFKRKVPQTSNAELNWYIKKVGQLAGINTPIKVSYKKGNQDMVAVTPKYALITTHGGGRCKLFKRAVVIG